MAKLITVRGPTRGREWELEGTCILGRSPSCQIYIGDLTISRQHARVTRIDNAWVLEDLGSGNGTYVNELRVTRQRLENEDEIRISNCVLRFVGESPAVKGLGGTLVRPMDEIRILLEPPTPDEPRASARAVSPPGESP